MKRRERSQRLPLWNEEEVAMLIQIVSHVDPEGSIMDAPGKEWTSIAKAAIYKAKATIAEVRAS